MNQSTKRGMSEMGLSFLFHKDVQKIFNNFHQLFGIRIAFFSPDGRELKVGNDASICRYCRSVRMCPGGAAACSAEDREGRILAYTRKKLVTYTCHGGMTEVVKPLIRHENLLGYAMIGQIRTEELPPVLWSSQWNATHDEKLEEIFVSRPMVGKRELMQIIEMFSYLMDLLISNNMIEQTDSNVSTKLSAYIQQHIDEMLPLSSACAAMNLSQSRLSHVVKEHYGISYTSLVRQLKMEQARFLLTHYPDMSVTEVASAVGFQDSQYFSKVFRKECAVSPSEYRKQQIFPYIQQNSNS
ncbi:MAG: PocR ligand-binding domain-containing protein [Sphaerochaetaceae bacterium]|nr:PocR ligand-binding domain-containing protein [Sphaerochaetaceae bacterium]